MKKKKRKVIRGPGIIGTNSGRGRGGLLFAIVEWFNRE
jgi:hypothetical protein